MKVMREREENSSNLPPILRNQKEDNIPVIWGHGSVQSCISIEVK